MAQIDYFRCDMPFCNRCGKENPPDASFCNRCGFQITNINNTYGQPTSYQIVELEHMFCGGSGKDTHRVLLPVKCQTCKGTGKVTLRIESTDQLVQCSNCGGSGVDDRSSLIGVECKRCFGTGKVPQKIPTYKF